MKIIVDRDVGICYIIYGGVTMENIIQVEKKTVYGNTLIYPANETAKDLCILAGKVTFTPGMIAICKRLGYVFVVVTGVTHNVV
jgi:hypothetical protein